MSGTNAWVTKPQLNPQATLRLFCFSYAGGGTSFFSSWVPALPSTIELCPIRLPGRESRLSERPYTRVPDIVPPLVEALTPYLEEKPFAFWGHSLGGFVAFEATRYLRRMDQPQPRHLFISGTRAPHLPDPDEPIHHLPEAQFIAELRRLNGTPEAVLQSKELLKLLMPCLRADFAASETYSFTAEPPLACDLTLFGGTDDHKANEEHLAAWEQHVTGRFNIHIFPGDHFFLHSQKEAVLTRLADYLATMP